MKACQKRVIKKVVSFTMAILLTITAFPICALGNEPDTNDTVEVKTQPAMNSYMKQFLTKENEAKIERMMKNVNNMSSSDYDLFCKFTICKVMSESGKYVKDIVYNNTVCEDYSRSKTDKEGNWATIFELSNWYRGENRSFELTVWALSDLLGYYVSTNDFPYDTKYNLWRLQYDALSYLNETGFYENDSSFDTYPKFIESIREYEGGAKIYKALSPYGAFKNDFYPDLWLHLSEPDSFISFNHGYGTKNGISTIEMLDKAMAATKALLPEYKETGLLENLSVLYNIDGTRKNFTEAVRYINTMPIDKEEKYKYAYFLGPYWFTHLSEETFIYKDMSEEVNKAYFNDIGVKNYSLVDFDEFLEKSYNVDEKFIGRDINELMYPYEVSKEAKKIIDAIFNE